MAEDQRLLKLGSYTVYAGASIAVIQTTHQIVGVGVTPYTSLLSRISVVTFIVNIAAAMWAFSFTGDIDDSWKILVFKTVFYFTAIISPYASVAAIFPETLKWYFCAVLSLIVLCLVITILKNKIKVTLTLAYEKAFWMLN